MRRERGLPMTTFPSKEKPAQGETPAVQTEAMAVQVRPPAAWGETLATQPEPPVRLEACHITKSFDGVTILDDVSIRLEEREIVSLLGVSGGGKTTLFNVISGLMKPDGGHVFLDGQEVTGRAGQISYMLQKDLLLPYYTVADNVALPLLVRGVKKDEAKAQAITHFEEFGLAGMEDKYPSQLSGGMRQRAALLRTYLFSDRVALLDEPFSALDTITKGEIHRWYLNVMEQIQLSTLFITHDIDEAILLSDRIYILAGRPGRIAAEIQVRRGRPRDREFTLSEEFLDYKRRILQAMEIE